MIKLNNSGNINVLVFPLVVTGLLLVGAIGFGFWAFTGMQDYKNNVDAKIATATEIAIKAEDVKKAAEFAEASKNPLKTYSGPDAYGSIRLQFPKTWSAYVDTSNGSIPVNGYFAPDVVPSTIAQSSSFALRVQVQNQSYSNVMNTMNNFVSNKKGTATAYSLPKLPNVVGMRFEGEIQPNKQGSMIVLPLRDKTLQVWTESSSFKEDFDKNILPNLTFSP